MDYIRICVFVAVLALLPGGARGEEPVAGLFRTAVSSDGARYAAARDALASRAGEARPVLEAALRSEDWRERVTAAAVLGWIDHRELYSELAEWGPPASVTRLHNPAPASAAAALSRLEEAGEAAVPFLLELVWKLGGDMWGAAPERLAALEVADALPVLGERLAVADSYHRLAAISRFGARATPYLLSALSFGPVERRGAILHALGETGDLAAAPPLLAALRAGATVETRQVAAAALGRLGAFAPLRAALGDLRGEEPRRAVLLALAGDSSAEGRAFLFDVATTGRHPSDRTAAVEALLERATPTERAAASALLEREPSARARARLVELLASLDQDDASVLRALLGALGDREREVRDAAAYGLRYFDGPEMTETLLRMLSSSDAESARLALVAAEHQCGRAFGDAAVRWLDDGRTRELALTQLRSNPTPAATEPVRRLLDDPDEHVRFLAALTLGYSDDPRARAALEAAASRESSAEVLRIVRECLAEWPRRSLCTSVQQGP